MKIKLFDRKAKMPSKSHSSDAGYDMYLPHGFMIEPNETLVIGLGVGFEIPEGFAGIFVPRSSIAKKGLIIQTSLIDPGYKGETHLIITNSSRNIYSFEKGDRVCSIIFVNLLNTQFEIVEEFENSDRGESGLGSTGK